MCKSTRADLAKSCQTSIYYLLANVGVDTAENGPLKVCFSLKLEKHRKNIGAGSHPWMARMQGVCVRVHLEYYSVEELF